MEAIVRLAGLSVLLLVWGGGYALFRWWAARADALDTTPAEELAWPVHRGATAEGRRYRKIALIWAIAFAGVVLTYLVVALRPET